MNAATADASSGSAGRALVPAWARTGLALVLVVATFAVLHPYVGIVADASLYLGRSLADLDPNGVGRDIAFVYDGQSRFSIFARIAGPLVAALGAPRASVAIAIAATLAMLVALAALARALTADPRLRFAIVMAAIILPSTYGSGVFRFAEASAVPRPFAEAAVVGAIAALLADRLWRAVPLLIVAAMIHPIMAMAGLGTGLVLLVWRRTARARLGMMALFVALAALAIGLGTMGAPLLDRFATRIDADWFAMLAQRSPYLFPSLWDTAAWAAPVVHAITLALAVQGEASPARRRVLVAVAMSVLLQLAAATIFGDAAHRLLAVQLQAWRGLWLLAMMASCCLPLVAVRLWHEGPQARVALALLGLATLYPIGLPWTLAVCAGALVLGRPSTVLPIAARHAAWALAGVSMILAARTVATSIGWARLVATEPQGAAIGWLAALRTDLLIAPLGIALAIWLLRRAAEPTAARLIGLTLVTLATVAAAAASWDQRAAADALFAKQDDFPLATAPGARSSEVFVFGGLSQAWFALGRPQYLSAQQASGIVFSRPLAMEWRRRADALRDLGLVSRDPLLAGDHVNVTAEKIAAFCRRADAPAAIVVPELVDAPAPLLPDATFWPANPPRPILADVEPARWRMILGWRVARCAAVPPELAKSAAR